MAVCSGPHCGQQIEWGISPDGARIPLTRILQGYLGGRDSKGVIRCVRLEIPDDLPDASLWISHFVVCPDAGRFSGRGRAG